MQTAHGDCVVWQAPLKNILSGAAKCNHPMYHVTVLCDLAERFLSLVVEEQTLELEGVKIDEVMDFVCKHWDPTVHYGRCHQLLGHDVWVWNSIENDIDYFYCPWI
jgi:hypothetical protein